MLLQISSAQGPLECQLAVMKALSRLQTEADARRITVTIVEASPGELSGTLRSVLVDLDGEEAERLASLWTGTVQWICASPYRPRHARKNWFIGVERCAETSLVPDNEVRFEATRARGPGGQHVNKTNSAIRATHLGTGIAVRVESERSQHANRRIAMELLVLRLREHMDQHAARERHLRRMHHFSIERGNPVRVFHGDAFSSFA